ncbi:MAG TPA: DUF2971 domain-containing protein [Candidatus Limnocylindrales bacterium]|nr:DUF2971 domain-containing protein [Candidatus Limnocylindrales bacterium]
MLQKLFGLRPPSTLYKYFAPERIDVLQNGKIRFSQPPVFNDPFESAPAFLELVSPKNLEIASRIEAERSGMPEEMRKAMVNRFSSAPYRNELMKTLGPLFIDTLVRTVGLLSLTEKYDNLLMWAHYAKSHEGFVIGFKTADPFLWHEDAKPHAANSLMKVRYSRRRPKLKFLSEVGLAEMYFTKSKEWAYEQEWRMFATMPSEDAGQMLESALASIAESGKPTATPDYPIRLFNFPPSAVSRVIVGCRASDETSKAVASIVNKKYRDAELLKAERDLSEFHLILRPLSK